MARENHITRDEGSFRSPQVSSVPRAAWRLAFEEAQMWEHTGQRIMQETVARICRQMRPKQQNCLLQPTFPKSDVRKYYAHSIGIPRRQRGKDGSCFSGAPGLGK